MKVSGFHLPMVYTRIPIADRDMWIALMEPHEDVIAIFTHQSFNEPNGVTTVVVSVMKSDKAAERLVNNHRGSDAKSR